ncbi:hypothetical protein TCAL_07523 [Tigriopus californicus]|uniref:Homeobox protein cut-like n=1 Tax=Tigriopus californicus TaxID=6832 RepID=A0A553NZQ1_TIGCA|nr:homeobox protein cut-like isoform X2 [Tigriopus californicus]TRY70911.1 hypothetical protein TCAL_07523 [Tigriopus californicus]
MSAVISSHSVSKFLCQSEPRDVKKDPPHPAIVRESFLRSDHRGNPDVMSSSSARSGPPRTHNNNSNNPHQQQQQHQQHHYEDPTALASHNRSNNSDLQKTNNGDHRTKMTVDLEMKSNNNIDNEDFGLATRIDVLQTTLNQVRRDTENEIARLRDELIEKNRTLERLESHLKDQRDYEELKRQYMILKSNFPVPNSEASREKSPHREDSSPISMGPDGKPGLASLPPPPKGLEMFLLQRAKALQHANPALKALVDLQAATAKPWLGDFMKVPLMGSPLNEDMLSAWRRNIEQNIHSSSSSLPPPPSPLSPAHRSNTPDRATPQDTRPASRASVSNGGGSTGGVNNIEDNNNGHQSPVRYDLKSPFKPDEPYHLFPPLPPSLMQGSPFLSSARIPKSDPIEGHLQDMLRYNMEKYAGQAIDTLASARRVRELLSIHNIGQRLFAKYVLGLSQGTVSELLSKPKCWEKLTEKGRDSYRKMHAWAYDENAVMMLKSLIPRKGEQPGAPSGLGGPGGYGGMPGQGMGGPMLRDDAFARFPRPPLDLLASTRLPLPPHMDKNKKPDMKRPDIEIPRLSTESSVKVSEAKPLDSKPSSDMMKDALQKLAFPSLTALAKESGDHRMGLGMAGGFMGKTAEEMQRAVELYQQELAKLQQRAMLGSSSLTGPNEASQSHSSGDKESSGGNGGGTSGGGGSCGGSGVGGVGGGGGGTDREERSSASSPCPTSPSRSGGGGGGVSPPKFSPSSFSPAGFLSVPSGSSAAPALIEEKLSSSASPLQGMASITNSLTSQPIHSPYRPNQRTFKAILPPVTQEQFDRYEHINTEELVRKIKELLSQYSISQRLFGENVLGLSQGSVSDLLARPKQYHMLTQKGKEPFIRMKLFLDDEHAVHKLVASQYKIVPEKLMRTGNYTGTYLPPTSVSPKLFPNSPFGLKPSSMGPGDFKFLPGAEAMLSDPFAFQRKLQEQQRLALFSGASSNVYEIAALTQELDTMLLTQRVKEVLASSNVGQKHFGEAVLGLSQGSVSELLCKPKPWHMLSIKGREPFIRMQLWLNDPLNIEKLHAFKSETESLKRKRESDSNPASPSELSDPYSGQADSPGSTTSSSKKQRVLFTLRQKESLKVAFNLDPYPSPSAMEFLAQELNLEPRCISNWFHNHRMRLKQTNPMEAEAVIPSSRDESRPFDPLHFRLMVNQRILELDVDSKDNTDGPSGLDLSKKIFDDTDDGDMYNDSPGAKKTCGDDGDTMDCETSLGDISPPTNRASRRKPIAPQWVNPVGWSGGEGKDLDEDGQPRLMTDVNAKELDESSNCSNNDPGELVLRKQPTNNDD